MTLTNETMKLTFETVPEFIVNNDVCSLIYDETMLTIFKLCVIGLIFYMLNYGLEYVKTENKRLLRIKKLIKFLYENFQIAVYLVFIEYFIRGTFGVW